MNSQASNGRNRNWPQVLLESAVLTSALLMASGVALANAPVVSEAPKPGQGTATGQDLHHHQPADCTAGNGQTGTA